MEERRSSSMEPLQNDVTIHSSHTSPEINTAPIDALIARLGPKAVFGDPVQAGETTVIPVAEIRTGFGFGGGSGRSATPRGDAGAEEGSGSGGGAGARVIPRGYLHVRDEGARFEPIVDVTRLSLAGMALTAWITFIIGRLLQR